MYIMVTVGCTPQRIHYLHNDQLWMRKYQGYSDRTIELKIILSRPRTLHSVMKLFIVPIKKGMNLKTVGRSIPFLWAL